MYTIDQTFKGKTGEALRVIELNETHIHLAVFESEFVMAGEIEKFSQLEVEEIDMKEYKRRVCAMKVFQDEKEPESKFEDYLIFFDQLKGYSDEMIDTMFNNYGGFSDYTSDT